MVGVVSRFCFGFWSDAVGIASHAGVGWYMAYSLYSIPVGSYTDFALQQLQDLSRRPTWLCAAAVSFLFGRIGRSSGREIDASQAERLGRSCLSIACSALSLARSAQAERDNESCIFVRAAGVHRFIRRYHIKKPITNVKNLCNKTRKQNV
ncbi:hypothetical protein EVAR_85791_1 [Eumeta japonica]|uniref:Uncharacterized protein n=1 Tax=Eumeta variegata TaxID=151549 RepID=A0A4C1URI8_EUMVA|nr:hypothetical protein EVAR_85791_1 [Eumeta japonica]